MTHNYELDTLGDMNFYPSYKYSLRSYKCFFDSQTLEYFWFKYGPNENIFNDDRYQINYSFEGS